MNTVLVHFAFFFLYSSLDTINTFYKKSNPKINTFDKIRMEALKKSIHDIVEKNRDIFPRPWECKKKKKLTKTVEHT